MKPILHATDCSQHAVAALKMAYALSQKLNAPLIVLHVFNVATPVLSSLRPTAAKKEQAALEAYRKKVVSFYKTHIGTPPKPKQVTLVVRNAPVTKAISQATAHFGAWLLVMGTKGKSALKNRIVGSSTRKMIKKSPCALLMVPPNVSTYSVEKITYATDFEAADLAAIHWLVQHLALPYKAQLHVLHVVSIQEENKGNAALPEFKAQLPQQVPYKKLFLTSVHSEDVVEALAAYPQQEDMDLLVMLQREKTGWLSFLLQPNSVKKMCAKTNVPLLSLNKALLQ